MLIATFSTAILLVASSLHLAYLTCTTMNNRHIYNDVRVMFLNCQNYARCEKYLKDTIPPIWRKNMLAYFSLDIICS